MSANAGRSENLHAATVEGFGREWQTFDFGGRNDAELDAIFGQYFSLFPWDALPERACGFDAGCGTGRWAARVAPRVGTLHCIDASAQAVQVAQRNLSEQGNCVFRRCTVDHMPLEDASVDSGYSLGVMRSRQACIGRSREGQGYSSDWGSIRRTCHFATIATERSTSCVTMRSIDSTPSRAAFFPAGDR